MGAACIHGVQRAEVNIDVVTAHESARVGHNAPAHVGHVHDRARWQNGPIGGDLPASLDQVVEGPAHGVLLAPADDMSRLAVGISRGQPAPQDR
jgi:hypothetical protein